MAATRNMKRGLTAGSAALGAYMSRNVHAQGSGILKVGLLGCGGRGNGAVRQCLNADPGVEVVAMADLFEAKVRKSAAQLGSDNKYKGRVNIKEDNMFWGFDCHEKIAKADVDIILMATAPAFRGPQMLAAVKAGKHVFTEKPVATDVEGCRQVMEAARIATQKGLSIVAGTQRRHEFSRNEVMKRVHDGQIGELVGGQCYWYGGGIWYRGLVEGVTNSELEWQCHNWYHFTWLSGDQVCEQHIHNIDMMNWCFNGPPKNFMAVGGRGNRDAIAANVKEAKKVCKSFNGTEDGWEKYMGDIYDHLYAEFEYENGARCMSYSGHGPNGFGNSEKIVGTKGTSNCNNTIVGENPWKYKGPNVNGMDQEHKDMIKGIRAGEPLNEGQRIAESTLTAIGARIAAYTGRTFSWKWLLKSTYDIAPDSATLKPGKGIFQKIPNGGEPLK